MKAEGLYFTNMYFSASTKGGDKTFIHFLIFFFFCSVFRDDDPPQEERVVKVEKVRVWKEKVV